MDFTAPISQFMTRKLITVMPTDKLSQVKEIFDTTRIHHIPVVHYTKLLGIISRSDILSFLEANDKGKHNRPVESTRLQSFTAEDVMTKGIASLSSEDRINVALEVFAENLFHAIPVIDDGELVGMLTPFDIIKALREEDMIRIQGSACALN